MSEKTTEAEITRLRAEVERLRAALCLFVCDCSLNCVWEWDEICPSWNARAAIAKAEKEGA